MELYNGTQLRNITPVENIKWLSEDEKNEYRFLVDLYQGIYMALSKALQIKHDDPKSLLNVDQMTFLGDKIKKGMVSDDPVNLMEFSRRMMETLDAEYQTMLIDMAPHCLYAYHEAMNRHELPTAKHHKLFIDSLMKVETGEIGTLLIASPAGSAKMLDAETPVLLEDGTYKRLRNIKIGDQLITHRGRACAVTDIHHHTNQITYEIILGNGRSLFAGDDHTHYTARGMVETWQLTTDDVMAIHRTKDFKDTSVLSNADIAGIIATIHPTNNAMLKSDVFEAVVIPDAIFRLSNRRLYHEFIKPYLQFGITFNKKWKFDWGKTVNHLSVAFLEQFMTLLDRLDIKYYYSSSLRTIVFVGDSVKTWTCLHMLDNEIPDGKEAIDEYDKGVEAGENIRYGKTNLISPEILNAPNYVKWGVLGALWRSVDEADIHNSAVLYNTRSPVYDNTTIDLTTPATSTFYSKHPVTSKHVRMLLKSLKIKHTVTKEKIPCKLGFSTKCSYYAINIKDVGAIVRLFTNANIQGQLRHDYDILVDDGAIKPMHDSNQYQNMPIISITHSHARDMICLSIDKDKTFTTSTCITHNTSYTSRSFVQWYMGRNPSKLLLGVGNSQSFIENQISKINRDAMKTDTYHRIFPDVEIDPQSRSAELWALKSPWRAKYKAVGAGSSVAGNRADGIMCDDLFKQAQDAQSQTVRDRIKSWMAGDIMSRLKPHGFIVMVNTIMHSDDTISYFIKQAEKQQKSNDNTLPAPTKVIVLQAECEDPETDPLGRKMGEYIWPEFYPKSHWETLKANLTSQQWACIYQNTPLDTMGENISDSEFQEYETYPEDVEGKEPQVLKTVAMIDTASKASERSDFTVITVFRQGMDKVWYVVDMWRHQLGLSDIASAIVTLHKKWDLNYVAVEQAGMGFQLVDEYSGKINVPIVPITIQGKGSKEFRAEKIFPYIKTGMILFPKQKPWMQEVKKEIIAFPLGKHDDIVDTYSLLVDHEFKYSGGGTKKLRIG